MIDLEPFIDTAKATLRAKLPTRIANLNAEKADGILVPVPDDTKGYLLGGRPTIYVPLPTVEIAASDFELQNPSLGQGSWELVPAIVIRATVEHGDADELYRMVMRFCSCIVDVLTEPGAFSGHVVTEGVRGSYRVTDGQDMNVRGYSTIQFTIGTVDHRPT